MTESKHVAFDTDLCAENPEAAADKIAELEDALKSVLASLVAITSLVVRAEDKKCKPSKAAPSDVMFLQMLKDYDRAGRAGRKALS